MNKSLVQIEAQISEISRVIHSIRWTCGVHYNSKVCYCNGIEELRELTNAILEEINTAAEKCECKCPICGELVEENCDCERCKVCNELVENEDCLCERCNECNELENECECG